MPRTRRRSRRRRASSVALRAASDRPLLDRILDTPRLAEVVPRLAPDLLHRIIETCGLEDCGDLIALASPDQLQRVLDRDLWRPDRPGRDEQFDANRFGVWLEVLVETNPDAAAERLAKLDVDLVVAGLSQHVRVFDVASITSPVTADGEDGDGPATGTEPLTQEIGGYHVAARRADAWHAIVAAMISLDADHPDHFHRIMRGCRRLSNSTPEVDGLHDLLLDDAQAMFDLSIDRERRREQAGFATPAQARAFLQMSRRHRPLDESTGPGDSVARAYFSALEPPAPAAAANALPPRVGEDTAPPAEPSDASVAHVVELLREAGIASNAPRALIGTPQDDAARFPRLHNQLQAVFDVDESVASSRMQELAYLANVLAAGCSIQDRPLTPQEAADAAAATCNLALETWPTTIARNFLVERDLVAVFQAGWAVLHERVCMRTAERLIEVLSRSRCADREIQFGLDVLRIEMTKHWRADAPWLARRRIDAIAMLDLPAWAALLALVDQLPVLHGAVAALADTRTRAVSPTAFEFIGGNRQIVEVDRFLLALPDILRR